MTPPSAIGLYIIQGDPALSRALETIFQADGAISVLGRMADPFAAAKAMRTVVPDLLVIDLLMPRMGGVPFLKRLMSQHPVPVVVVTRHAETHPDLVKQIRKLGAYKVISLQAGSHRLAAMHQGLLQNQGRLQNQGLSRVLGLVQNQNSANEIPPHLARQICQTAHNAVRFSSPRKISLNAPDSTLVQPKHPPDMLLPSRGPVNIPRTEPIIVVGASTGGTEALKRLLAPLPATLPGMVIVQHMPGNFTGSFAQQLNSVTALKVHEAKQGEAIRAGTALLAPGGDFHTIVQRQKSTPGQSYVTVLKEGPPITRHRPSVDILFRSAAQAAGANAIGVIMTGMGDDGARCMKELHDAGAFTLAQNEASCIVYGMPKEAIAHGGVDKTLSLEQLPQELLRAVERLNRR